MELIFGTLKSVLDGVGIAFVVVLGFFAFGISFVFGLFQSRKQREQQKKAVEALYPKVPASPLSPQQEKDAEKEGVAVGMGDKDPVDYFNDLSKK
jgi:hypothetical protein